MKEKNGLKKTLAVFLVVVLLLTSSPLQGFVGLEWPDLSALFITKASAASEGYYFYTISDGKATITDCDTSISGAVVIPDTLGGYPVTSIGNEAFCSCTDLTSVAIGNSVKSIGIYAFLWCKNLTSVTIPSSVTSIDKDSFAVCKGLTSITVDSSNEYYSSDDYGVLFNKNKTSLIQYPIGKNNTTYTIPNSVTTIGSSAFSYCDSLTSITIPDSVTSIGDAAFGFCDSLTSLTIPDSVTSVGSSAFYGCTGLTSVTIPHGVAKIGERAFYQCTGLTSVTIPDSVTSIGGSAFNGCTSLTSITIPDSVTSIGEYAFYVCTSLTSVTIGNSITSICEATFRGCTGLTSVTIGNRVVSIGDYAFEGCDSLTSVTIPHGVAKIGERAFYQCTGLTSVTIPDSVTSIGEYAFSYCCSLRSVTIPYSITSIANGAFFRCTSLTSVTIPSSVTRIGAYAFYVCTSLTSITIPDSVTSIGTYAFVNCTSLISITVDSANKYYSSDGYGVLFNKDKTALIQYPIGNSRSSYSIPDSVTSIGDYAFCDCTSLTSITIPDSVTRIGNYGFYGCTNLTSITIPDSVTSIGNYSFYKCNSLTSITIPDSVTSIGDGAFDYCTSLTSITIPDSVTSIGDGAFHRCTSLTSITVDSANNYYSSDGYGVLFKKDKTTLIQYPTGNSRSSYSIPDSVTSIGNEAFRSCDSLTSVTIGNSVTSIGHGAFFECTSLTSVTIGNSVTSIGNGAFRACTSLTSITIPDSVTGIGYDTFNSCSKLKDVYYSGTEAQWKAIIICSNNECLTNATIHFLSEKETEIDELEIFALQFLTDELNRLGVGPLTHYYNGFTTKPFENKRLSEIIGSLVQTKQTNYKWKTIGGNKMNEDGFDLTGTSEDLYEQCLFNSDGSNKWAISKIYRDEETGFFAIVYNQIGTDLTVFSVGASNGLGDNYDVFQIARVIYNAFVLLKYGEAPGIGTLVQKICTSEIQKALRVIFGNDWGDNDFPLYVSNIGGVQIPYALEIFDEYQKEEGSDRDIVFTGHSLGAALSILLSTRYDLPAIVFDSIPMLDVSYYRYYTEMGEKFRGCDEWKYVDIMNNEDVLAASWEKQYKNYVAVNGTTAEKTNTVSTDEISAALKEVVLASMKLGMPGAITGLFISETSKEVAEICEMINYVYPVFLGHDPRAMLIQDENGNFSFAAEIDENQVDTVEKSMGEQTLEYSSSSSGYEEVVRLLLKESLTLVTGILNKHLKDDMLLLGTSKTDLLYYYSKNEGNDKGNDVIYGGDGSDSIISGEGDDVLIGGRGDDNLYGEYGDDTYIYYKGDGLDYIADYAGNDTILLYGFDKDDEIVIETVDGCKHIYASGDLIMKVAMFRSGNITNSIVVKLCDENDNVIKSKKIQDWNHWKSKKIVVACPVYVEILNAQGEVVLTIENKETDLISNEYGVFFVKEVSDGEFVKYIYLYDESYTVRVVGEDEGKMSYSETTIDDNGVIYVNSADEIEVSAETIITSTSDGTVLNCLKDSNSEIEEIPLIQTKKIPVESITLNEQEVTLCIDNEFDLVATVNPENATIGEVVYYSKNPAVADVNEDGRITAVSVGKTEIIVDLGNKEVSCTVNVNDHDYKSVITSPSCTEGGYITYTCYCGDTYTETLEATGHDFDGNICKNCGVNRSDSCGCNCHKSGIVKFFFKIGLLFQKIFKKNKVCRCGVYHY